MNLPWPESWAVFLIALWPAQFVSIIWHEAGHVVAARFAGLQTLAWGIGVRRPWMKLRLGRSVFYLALPTSMGLTIYRRKLIERQPMPEFLCILGGPAASWIAMLAGLGLWQYGGRSDILAAWIAITALHALTSSIPFMLQQGALRLDNDARLLIDIARYGPKLARIRWVPSCRTRVS